MNQSIQKRLLSIANTIQAAENGDLYSVERVNKAASHQILSALHDLSSAIDSINKAQKILINGESKEFKQLYTRCVGIKKEIAIVWDSVNGVKIDLKSVK